METLLAAQVYFYLLLHTISTFCYTKFIFIICCRVLFAYTGGRSIVQSIKSIYIYLPLHCIYVTYTCYIREYVCIWGDMVFVFVYMPEVFHCELILVRNQV